MIGPKLVGRIQSVTTTLALIPIIGTAILGWFWFDGKTYMDAWNVTGKSTVSAIGMTLNFTLWALLASRVLLYLPALLKILKECSNCNYWWCNFSRCLLCFKFFCYYGHDSEPCTCKFIGTFC